ncbi:Minimal nucleotidyltransferase [Halalkaliarchaeum sp. AArc-CO]|uniref:type VII toxin-antitoxin system MntA family adenylyltransferase antitoxin n=1 Tax=Halalkaliarchaeum sp. AArc-CO TaxID=2866381 RepID=UPI00217E31FC|nr:nucleotidyltransferase domain-containing protein [Halalkaliarchaeum sp. AArc-CO]UWG51985.1 Minimal nucleotidyltransferase [Halalkaliarchaeum sp. AArc-CO]
MAPAIDDVDGIDVDAIRGVLEGHPIRLGVLFGSQVTGSTHAHSDVDVAVEFDAELSSDDRRRARLDVIVELTRELGTDDVDVVDLDGVRPAVGKAALERGVLLVGSPDRADRLRRRFADRTPDDENGDRLARFDALLAEMEEAVDV